eukprot:SAG31_NODE_2482_length_5634_cov_1.887805_3_plen_154_part_00
MVVQLDGTCLARADMHTTTLSELHLVRCDLRANADISYYLRYAMARLDQHKHDDQHNVMISAAIEQLADRKGNVFFVEAPLNPTPVSPDFFARPESRIFVCTAQHNREHSRFVWLNATKFLALQPHGRQDAMPRPPRACIRRRCLRGHRAELR